MKSRSIIIVFIVFVLVLAGAGVAYFLFAPQAQDEVGMSAAGVTASSEEDKKAPDFTALDQQGEEVSLSSLEGKPVIINFWTSWCTYCKQEMADFEQAYKTYGDRIDFMILNATTDSKESMSKAESYIESKGFDLPFYFDTTGQATELYSITVYPTTYFIDAQGNIVGEHPGLMDAETIDETCEILLGNY